MKNLTKDNWIPAYVSLPDTRRVVGFNTIKEKRGYTIDWKQEKSNS